MRVVVVIQARMGSSRLPGKVMMPAAGGSILARMLDRVLAASTPSEVVIATTTDPGDEPIRSLCRGLGVAWLAGHPTDLLDRHLQAARAFEADAVVKIPSDCPLIDPHVIDRVIGHYLARDGELDFVSNLHPPTYPDGMDVEVVATEVLETAGREAERPLEREHTTPFVWDQPDRFRVGNVTWETGLDYSHSHRLTLDYLEDYHVIRAIYDELWSPRWVFGLSDILALLEQRPDIAGLNAKHRGVSWYRHHPGELKTLSNDSMEVRS